MWHKRQGRRQSDHAVSNDPPGFTAVLILRTGPGTAGPARMTPRRIGAATHYLPLTSSLAALTSTAGQLVMHPHVGLDVDRMIVLDRHVHRDECTRDVAGS